MPKAPVDAAPSNQWLADEPENVVAAEDADADETIAAPAPGPARPRPPVKASRQAWADHALASGASEHEIAEMTKAQLIGAYGGGDSGG